MPDSLEALVALVIGANVLADRSAVISHDICQRAAHQLLLKLIDKRCC
ncbi:hypothetical protein [Streptomyces sp. NPDC088762]